MKARYRYRIYPKQEQKTALAQLFGCVRVVWNDSLAFCIEQYQKEEKKPKNGDLQKQFITQAKKTIEREWLGEVSAIPLQQSLNDLNQAYQNFFKSCKGIPPAPLNKGGRKGGRDVKFNVRTGPPRFKKRKSRQSARFTRGGFKVGQHNVYLAKIGKVKIVWSRE
ncbi:RNA-guided endonuclease InsQ/TnpB family protein, partial [Spirulina sp. 06S082]|uniref:RNA-guided endonuclease InsQ/TnpB family protein n=1 Tax=Spirulina sp. 06S082 TaxID=3110248 RepID=UPI002B1FB1B7